MRAAISATLLRPPGSSPVPERPGWHGRNRPHPVLASLLGGWNP